MQAPGQELIIKIQCYKLDKVRVRQMMPRRIGRIGRFWPVSGQFLPHG